MTDLSIVAQAILTAQAKQRCLNEWDQVNDPRLNEWDHVNDPPCHPSDNDWDGCYQCVDRRGLAAALRAAADQCHSQEIREADYTTRRWICLDDLLAIVAELEGNR